MRPWSTSPSPTSTSSSATARAPSPRPRSCPTSASGTRRARSIARSSPRWPSWASSVRRSRRPTAARAWTTSASRILCEELERADTAFRVVQSVHVGLNSLALLQWGTEEQRQRWLVPQAKGEKLATFGLTEPGVGTDAGNLADHRPPRRRRLPAQRPEDVDQPGRHRRPLPGLRVGRPRQEAQGRHGVPARARDARPDDRHAPRQARDPGREHRPDQPRRRAGPGGPPDRRGGGGVPHRDERHRPGALHGRRRRGRARPGLPRRQRPLRARAPDVRRRRSASTSSSSR